MDRIPNYVWTLGALALWGAAILFFGLVRFTPYAMDEGAARALLLNWSVADQVVSPILVLGLGDLRSLLFLPLGVYWTGSIVAAKVYAIIFLFVGILALYRWSREQFSEEVALMASGLMMVAPLSLLQLDSISPGVFVLAMFGLGMWANDKYRAQTERSITGWYFIQALLVAITATLHPMGLAYPLALAWQWQQQAGTGNQRKNVFIGLAVSLGIVLAMQAGWVSVQWLGNPLPVLADMVYRISPDEMDKDNAMVIGTLVFLLLIPAVIHLWRQAGNSLMGRMLALAALIGLFCADSNWVLIAQAVMLYAGINLLIRLNGKLPANNFAGQRGLVMALVFGCLFWFMQLDKAQAMQISNNILTPTDRLIEQLSVIASNEDLQFRAATQWPGRTIIATRRDALPLPRGMKDSAELEAKTRDVITHFVFNHADPDNSELARNLAGLSQVTETLVLEEGGVIIAYRDIPPMEKADAPAPAPAVPAAADIPELPTESKPISE